MQTSATTDADAFLTTSTSNLTTSPSQHLTTSPSINNNGKVDIPSTLPLSLK
ncbi:hypothetical protein [Leyella stercorea]|uniref:hypothetical protein n=1 Tax=Leyella stercorea TaxID=363265 RepID=UPI003A8EFF93